MTKKKKNYYFTQETENAIIQYNKLDPEKDYKKRNWLYKNKIYQPFNKMAENLIHTFKFYYFDIPPTDVQKQVASFMTSKLDHYDPTAGKAFSYFSIVGKNWLIYHNNKNYNYKKIHLNPAAVSDARRNYLMNEIAERMNKNPSEEKSNDYKNIIYDLANYIEKNIDILWNKQRDKNIAWGIITILRRHREIETIHKKALYVLIREYSGEKTIYITKVLKKINIHYKKIKERYYNNKVDKYTFYNLLN